LSFVSRAMTILLNAVDSADRVPPAQVTQTYLDSSRDLKKRSSEWARFKETTLRSLNDQLHSAGLMPVNIGRIEKEAEESLAR